MPTTLQANPRTVEQAREVAARIASDPAWFAETILGHSLWTAQGAILRAIARPRARVAVKCCHASLKTYSAAEAVLWATYVGGIWIRRVRTDLEDRVVVCV